MADTTSASIADKILDKWEGKRMIERNFGEPEELIEELKNLIIVELDKLKQ